MPCSSLKVTGTHPTTTTWTTCRRAAMESAGWRDGGCTIGNLSVSLHLIVAGFFLQKYIFKKIIHLNLVWYVLYGHDSWVQDDFQVRTVWLRVRAPVPGNHRVKQEAEALPDGLVRNEPTYYPVPSWLTGIPEVKASLRIGALTAQRSRRRCCTPPPLMPSRNPLLACINLSR